MLTNFNQYITESNIHGECDICRMDGSINKVVGGRYLCRGCIDTVDSLADSRVYDDDSGYDDIEEAFAAIVEESVGGSVVLHFPNTEDSPTDAHTYTVEGVEAAETEFGDENTVVVTKVGGDTREFTGIGLTIAGLSL